MWMFVVILLVLILAYVLEGRAWLKKQPWSRPFFAWVEPIEIALYRKSETLLTARLLSIGGFIVTAYDSVATFLPGLDLTPLTDRLLRGIPESARGLVLSGLAMGVGLLIAWLRKRTTMPLDQVAAPDSDNA